MAHLPIRLSVPATLDFKDLVLRAATLAAAASVENGTDPEVALRRARTPGGVTDRFTMELVSAISELVNNIAKHGHRDRVGTMDICFTPSPGCIEIEIRECGEPFDIGAVTGPDLDALPESGMGLYIVRSFVDELWYEPGAPNRWSLVKYRSRAAERARTARLRAARARAVSPMRAAAAPQALGDGETPPPEGTPSPC